MTKTVVSLLFLSVLLYACQTSSPPDIVYTVTVKTEDAVPQLLIKMRLAASSNGKTILEYPDAAWGQEKLHDALVRAAVTNSTAEITQEKDSGWIVIDHPKELEFLEFEYTLQQDFAEVSSRKVYRPIVQADYFHLYSHNFFMLPKDREAVMDIQLNWQTPAEGYIVHNSFGTGATTQILHDMAIDEFSNAIFVGGDFRVYMDTIKGNSISLATRGQWIPFKEQEILDILKETLSSQRNFWNDHSQEYFTVTLQPFPQASGSSFQGTGLTNSFATSVSNNEFVELEQLVYLFNHELNHNWIGNTIKNSNEEEQYWFSEGFTEYYTWKNIAKYHINGLDTGFFIDELNKAAQNLYTSPVKNAPNSEINYENFWRSWDYGKLPYYRGSLYAFYLDQQILKQSQGAQSLDDVMRQILDDAVGKGQQLSHDYFLQVISSYLDKDVAAFFEKHIIRGEEMPMASLFRELGLEYASETEVFEQGFELSEDRKEILAVTPGSNAANAGLRQGDKVARVSIAYDDITKAVELEVRRNAVVKKVSFYPKRIAPLVTLKNTEKNRALLMP